MKKISGFFLRQIDAVIYGLVGPFTVLFIVPKYLLVIEKEIGMLLPVYQPLKYLGIVLMNLGGFLAIWCAIIMFLTTNTPSIFSKPQKIIEIGPYKVVRHPMMWALFLVLAGEVMVESSLFILIWFLIFIRFSIVYIKRNEEPLLISIFGDDYIHYSKKVPRWFPKRFKNIISK